MFTGWAAFIQYKACRKAAFRWIDPRRLRAARGSPGDHNGRRHRGQPQARRGQRGRQTVDYAAARIVFDEGTWNTANFARMLVGALAFDISPGDPVTNASGKAK
ncbi:hypothetical protein [Dactylosporangium sp. NPDC048998]|uniref:hypothetical protein n=1 Tax=Dactylosporangium sp. NPDC048998 TaxID=3363976 RepID=UPI0037206DD6